MLCPSPQVALAVLQGLILMLRWAMVQLGAVDMHWPLDGMCHHAIVHTVSCSLLGRSWLGSLRRQVLAGPQIRGFHADHVMLVKGHCRLRMT